MPILVRNQAESIKAKDAYEGAGLRDSLISFSISTFVLRNIIILILLTLKPSNFREIWNDSSMDFN